MIELRWDRRKRQESTKVFNTTTRTVYYDVLQYRVLFHPVMIASGDITLQANESAEWMDVPRISTTEATNDAQ